MYYQQQEGVGSGRVITTHHYWVQTVLEGGGADAADLLGFRSCPQAPPSLHQERALLCLQLSFLAQI